MKQYNYTQNRVPQISKRLYKMLGLGLQQWRIASCFERASRFSNQQYGRAHELSK